jgi:hypothetical protein
MHFLAAMMCCFSDREDRQGRALQHAQQAIELGFSAKRFNDVPQFETLFGKEQFSSLLSLDPRQVLLPDPPRVLDPDPTPKEFYEN